MNLDLGAMGGGATLGEVMLECRERLLGFGWIGGLGRTGSGADLSEVVDN